MVYEVIRRTRLLVASTRVLTAMMMRVCGMLAVFAVLGCSKGGDSAIPNAQRPAPSTKHVGGEVEKQAARPANRMGRIPVLEYHVVGDSTRGEFIISRQKFEHDLQLLYDRGYRP